MTTKTAVADDNDDIQWEDIRSGLGESWDLTKDGPLTGYYLGSQEQEIQDKQTGELRKTLAHQFAPHEQPDAVVFVWGSAQLDKALTGELIAVGDLVRLTFLGVDQYTDKVTGAPRMVKRYRVQAQKRV